jgi:photosystem II stability/assembly factor-like uncharacterized protein
MRSRGLIASILALVLSAGFGGSGVAGDRATAASRPVQLMAIHMIDATTGWALSPHAVLRTSDGGIHWMNVTPRGMTFAGGPGTPIDFLTSRVGWVAITHEGTRRATVIHTVDGGRTWQHASVALPGPLFQIQQIDFIDAHHGWLLTVGAVGTGHEEDDIFRSTDGGAHWVNVSYTGANRATPGSLSLGGDKNGISFRDTSTGFASGSTFAQGFLWFYVTHDGGRTWEQQALPLPPAYRATTFDIAPPQFFTPWDGILVVGIGSILSPLVYVTHDGGRTWTSTTSTTPLRNAVIVSFINVSDGWAIQHESTAPGGKARLYVTSDGGRHWMTIIPNVRLQWVMPIQFVSRRIGFALHVGLEPKEQSWLLKTMDGGRTWHVLHPEIVP